MEAQTDTMPQAMALAVFSRQLSTLVDTGMTLVRSLKVLAADAPQPYAAASAVLCDEVIAGRTLAHAMSDRPDLFSPFYVRVIRVGEVGGIMEVSFSFLADMAEEGWIATRQSGPGEAYDWLLNPSAQAVPGDWSALTAGQRTFALMSFTWALGVMIGSGVPPNVTVEVAADLLPGAQREAVRGAARADLSAGLAGPLAAAGFLPTLVIEALDVSDHYGEREAILARVADAYRREFRCRIALRAGS